MKLLVFVFCIFSFSTLYAADESYIQTLSGNIRKGDTCTVVDDKFRNLPLSEWNALHNLSVVNLVTFELRQDTSIYFYGKTFTCSLNVSIQYYKTRDQIQPDEISNVWLVVKFDTASGKYFPLSAKHQFKGGFYVKVIVHSIQSPELGRNLPPIFRLKNQILVNRKYPFVSQVNAAFSLTNGSPVTAGTSSRVWGSLNSSNGKITIQWQPSFFPGSEEFDIEWTFIDKYSYRGTDILGYGGPTGPFTIPQVKLESWMRYDATRVTVSNQISQYDINVPYDEGFVIVRIRGVAYQVNTELRLTTNWSYTNASNQTACIAVTTHEPKYNWQYTASFAEEGKRKEVISYFDATLRNRQSVTINNSDDKAVIGETIYDNMGRPSVSILPVPKDDNRLKYYPAFNLNYLGQPYSFTDVTSPTTQNCSISASSLHPDNGAGNYYSLSNPFINSSDFYFSNYVPDAEGYPFAVTQYMPDNTGRVRKQGGVGPEFQIGMNHETFYFYVKPLPNELNRLFGTEVGNSSHYQKNVVIDPNGQISYSYVNSAGKTIATSLAGGSPENLDALPSAENPLAQTHFNEVLIRSSDFQVDGVKKIASATFFAAVMGTFKVHFEASPAALITNYGAGGSLKICSDCSYDILVEVKNDCGVTVATTTTPAFTPNDVTCYVSPLPFTQILNVPITRRGEYTVTYTLKLSEDVIKFQTDHFVETNTDLKTLQDFFHEEVVKADLAGCYSNCQDCEEKLGTEEKFTANMMALLQKLKDEKYSNYPNFDINHTIITTWISETYWELYNNCQSLRADCGNINACDEKLERMKLDVQPGGQYAPFKYDEATGVYSFLEHQINVMRFYNDASLPNIYYMTVDDPSGNPVMVGSMSESDFIQTYLLHPEWADEFVTKHIEYCSYLWCVENDHSEYYKYEEKIKRITKGQAAIDQNVFDPSDLYKIIDQDYFFQNHPNYDQQIRYEFDNFSDVMHIQMRQSSYPYAILPGKNLMEVIHWMLYCKPTDPNASPSDFEVAWTHCGRDPACASLTQEWELYRNYYLQLRGKYLQMAKQESNACDNCFIGTDPFSNSGCTPYGKLDDYTAYYDQNNGVFYGVYKLQTERFLDDYELIYRYFVNGIEYRGAVTAIKDDWTVLLNLPYPDNGEVEIISVSCIKETNCAEPYYPSTMCREHKDYVYYKNKQKIWDDYVNTVGILNCMHYGNMPQPTPGASLDQVRALAISQLDAMKESWIERLQAVRDEEGFPISNTTIDNLVNELYELAKVYIEIAPVENIRAASSLPPGYTSPNGFTNFKQVFQAFIPSSYIDKGFGPDLLDQPYPYDLTPITSSPQILNLSNTTCQILDDLYNRFTQITGNSSLQDFHTYLKNELTDDYRLSFEQLEEMWNKCRNGCRILEETLLLPAIFAEPNPANPNHPWVGCDVVNNLVSEFQHEYPGVAEDTKLQRLLLGNYLNFKLGYALSIEEYLDFINEKCPHDPEALLYNKPASPLIVLDDFGCVANIMAGVFERAGYEYDYYIDSVRKKFRADYVSKCLENEAKAKIEGDQYEYHYTLYYYDKAGNLVKTVPPEGVQLFSEPDAQLVETYRETNSTTFHVPLHRMVTTYVYNSLNQVVKQTTPDAGTTEFWYDRLGRLTASQNAEQKTPTNSSPANRFSYTKYDALGRTTEVGEKLSAATMTESIARDPNSLNPWLNSGTNRQVTLTYYDEQPAWAPSSIAGMQYNLRKRVAATVLLTTAGNPANPASNRESGTYYSYDLTGNVSHLVQENQQLVDIEMNNNAVNGSDGLKHLKYKYDLISGKINKVIYQEGRWDQFFHWYKYDADNRLIKAMTSREDFSDENEWVTEATYRYYLHGPLARVELGREKVQGMDYAYTLQGWLKGVNGHFLNQGMDMSLDGYDSWMNFNEVGRDAFAFTLGYYQNDYRPVDGSSQAFPLNYQYSASETGAGLYNGNISHATYAMKMIEDAQTRGYTYRYDQLNRLKAMRFHEIDNGNPYDWDNGSIIEAYAENITYDANGNIDSYERNGDDRFGGNLEMDRMRYIYPTYTTGPNSGKKKENRLSQVEDEIDPNNYDIDIDWQDTNNYVYDNTGNLIRDKAEQLGDIQWNVYGKISNIYKETGEEISYYYDAGGNRNTKALNNGEKTFYVRDAQGNVMAVYKFSEETATYTWQEQHIYGSARIGMLTPDLVIDLGSPIENDYDPGNDPVNNGVAGKRIYELSNHLGNVLVTISDLRIGIDENGDSYTDYYEADVLTAQDYYPFGMMMKDRKYSISSSYRYGYTSQEMDNEIIGVGINYTAKYWEYDSRIGRRWNVDPEQQNFPFQSPFATMDNDPINKKDPDGRTASGPGDPQVRMQASLTLGTGGLKANVSIAISASSGYLSGAYGSGVTYHSNFWTTGKKGIEIRNSFMVTYDDGKTGGSLSTNFWSGTGKLRNFAQRTGMLNFHSGDVNISYENDGTPFQKIKTGDGNDSYRTTAASVSIGDFSLNMHLFTGRRDKGSYALENKMGGLGSPSDGKFGEKYKHGFVVEKGPQYRYGGLALGYKGSSVGINSEWVRHIGQNKIAHEWIQKQREFEMLSGDVKPVLNVLTPPLPKISMPKFSNWQGGL